MQNDKKQELFKDSCGSIDSLNEFLEAEAKKHKHLFSYEKKEHHDNVINNKAIYLSDGSNWCDSEDVNNLKNDKNHHVYAKCFCYLKNESVAMWMLYGGLSQEGYRIDYTSKLINDIVKNKNNYVFKIGSFDINGHFKEEYELKNEDFSVFLHDVVYYIQHDKDKHVVLHKGDCFSKFEHDINEIKYCKKYPWKYESECRLIVRVNNDIYKKHTSSNTVQININNSLFKNLRFTISPKYEDDTRIKDGRYKLSILRKMVWDIDERKDSK